MGCSIVRDPGLAALLSFPNLWGIWLLCPDPAYLIENSPAWFACFDLYRQVGKRREASLIFLLRCRHGNRGHAVGTGLY